jgi:hypothetical protein
MSHQTLAKYLPEPGPSRAPARHTFRALGQGPSVTSTTITMIMIEDAVPARETKPVTSHPLTHTHTHTQD